MVDQRIGQVARFVSRHIWVRGEGAKKEIQVNKSSVVSSMQSGWPMTASTSNVLTKGTRWKTSSAVFQFTQKYQGCQETE